MKKTLAILLSLICVFSLVAFSASAAIEDLLPTSDSGLEMIENRITYKKDTLDGVVMMYKPFSSVSFNAPGWVTVTRDTPIAVDHDFVCWRDKNGNRYYEGDKIYVVGEVELYAVWQEKDDLDLHSMRVVKCALKTFVRMFEKVLGIFKDIDDFEEDYFGTTIPVLGD